MDVLKEINSRKVFFDGGFGSLLIARGLKPGELTEVWNITHPEDVINIHLAYLEAGCEIINANTFGVNTLKHPKKSGYSVEELVNAAMANAHEAIRRYQANHPTDAHECAVTLDIGPSGEMFEPFGDLEEEDAVEIFTPVIKAGVAAGADIIIAETMMDITEITAIVKTAKELSDLPVFATMSFDQRGKTFTGTDIEEAFEELEDAGADAIGMNCGLGPDVMQGLIGVARKSTRKPLIIKPNAGLPDTSTNPPTYNIQADQFAAIMQENVKLGADIVGGCCGTTPEYLKAMIEKVHEI